MIRGIDFLDERVIAWFATTPRWYADRIANMSDEDAGKLANAIVLTLTGRGNELDRETMSDVAFAAYLTGLTWLDDVIDCVRCSHE